MHYYGHTWKLTNDSFSFVTTQEHRNQRQLRKYLTIALASQAGQLEQNVMMPIIAHTLFEMMQVMIGAVNAFTEKCVRGLKANRVKAEGWLEKNAIVVTALNPLIGYAAGAELVKAVLASGGTVR